MKEKVGRHGSLFPSHFVHLLSISFPGIGEWRGAKQCMLVKKVNFFFSFRIIFSSFGIKYKLLLKGCSKQIQFSFTPKMWSQGNHIHSLYSYLLWRAKAWQGTWKYSLLFENVALQHATLLCFTLVLIGSVSPAILCNWVNCDRCLILLPSPIPFVYVSTFHPENVGSDK